MRFLLVPDVIIDSKHVIITLASSQAAVQCTVHIMQMCSAILSLKHMWKSAHLNLNVYKMELNNCIVYAFHIKWEPFKQK